MVKFNHWTLRFFPKWVDAYVFRDTVYVRGPSISLPLLLHEQVHLEQYRRYGTIGFLARYAWYSLRYGYRNNPLEIEANQAA